MERFISEKYVNKIIVILDIIILVAVFIFISKIEKSESGSNSYTSSLDKVIAYTEEDSNIKTGDSVNINDDIDSKDNSNSADADTSNYASADASVNKMSSKTECFLDGSIGYRLRVVDAALGSRYYGLDKTTDGGSSWSNLNTDPFNGKAGSTNGIRFINEQLGFISLSGSSAERSTLYRTTDGGGDFNEVTIPLVKITAQSGDVYTSFDMPYVPYEEDGKLVLLVGQGQDGDIDGGCDAKFISEDEGITWVYVGEVK